MFCKYNVIHIKLHLYPPRFCRHICLNWFKRFMLAPIWKHWWTLISTKTQLRWNQNKKETKSSSVLFTYKIYHIQSTDKKYIKMRCHWFWVTRFSGIGRHNLNVYHIWHLFGLVEKLFWPIVVCDVQVQQLNA